MKKVRTFWGSSDLYVPEDIAEDVQKIADEHKGNCPSGPTFDSKSFWKALGGRYPTHEAIPKGRTAQGPWGRMSERTDFIPAPKTFWVVETFNCDDPGRFSTLEQAQNYARVQSDRGYHCRIIYGHPLPKKE